MNQLLRNAIATITGPATERGLAKPEHRAVPTLERLEDRTLPTVTYHGGALLPRVEAQPVYLGSDWYYNSSLYSQTGQFNNFVRYLVNSSYMDMLTSAGYGVGRGGGSNGIIGLANIDKRYYLTDSQIQSYLQSYINGHSLARPDANRLYVVYVEPGVAVKDASGETSIANFQGYHSWFRGSDGYGYRLTIPYVVVPYHTGFNSHDTRVSTFGSMTETSSHEIAEAVTDPLGSGWYQYNSSNGEIGDLVNHQIVSFTGYVVQKEANKYGQPMSPPGSYPLFGSLSSAASPGFGANTALFGLPAPLTSAASAIDALFAAGKGFSLFG
jgi:hypothetical protein